MENKTRTLIFVGLFILSSMIFVTIFNGHFTKQYRINYNVNDIEKNEENIVVNKTDIEMRTSRKNQIAEYEKKVLNVSRKQFNNKFNEEEARNAFYKKIEEGRLFDSDGVPYELDYNVLRIKNLYSMNFNEEQTREFIKYMDILVQTFPYSDKPQKYDLRNGNEQIKRAARNMKPKENKGVKLPDYCGNRVDVLWIYVNGSDPHWIESYQKALNVTIEGERFREYGSLKYSMRSVYENVPYDIHWHLIIQDEYQIPTFLDKQKLIYYNDESKPGTLRIIYHRDIFDDTSVLPVFNSNAIEAAFANIKGMGECFMYLNDDFFVNSKISPATNFNDDGSIRSFEDYYSSGECESCGKWFKAISNANAAINKLYGVNMRRHRMSHHWFMFRTSALKEVGEIFKAELAKTRKNKLRTNEDYWMMALIQIYMIREGYSVPQFEDDNAFFYTELLPKRVIKGEIFKTLQKKQHPFVCLNDKFDGNKDEVDKAMNIFTKRMELLYPTKTPFEII